MDYIRQVQELVQKISGMAKKEGKASGFCIGNTTKLDAQGLYFTPIRDTSVMVVGGVIVYSEKQAIDITEVVDGQVQYVLVDAEKKIPDKISGEFANVERVVREALQVSTLWIYKGNDLSVEAVDVLLTQLTKKSVRGLGGKKVVILGAGNLGSKLALKLVERAAQVVITRRNKEILDAITIAINSIKPRYTHARVVGMTDNEEAAKGAEILIGTTVGTPVITSEIVANLAENALIVDVGKGVLQPEAFSVAQERGLDVYRLDISAAFEGLIHKLWAAENIQERMSGRRQLYDESLVSGGLLGRKNEMVVDNVWNPRLVYGLADGQGDFVRNPSKTEQQRIEQLRTHIER